MSIQKLVLTNKYTSQPTEPTPTGGFTAQTLKEEFQKQPNQIEAFINSLIDQLESIVAGKSGAELIGSATINGVAGLTVHAQMASLKQQITASVIGNIPDGTLTGAKFQDNTITGNKIAHNTITGDNLNVVGNQVTILKSSWASSTDFVDFSFQVDVTDARINNVNVAVEAFFNIPQDLTVLQDANVIIGDIDAGNNSVRFYAESQPATDLPVRIKVVR